MKILIIKTSAFGDIIHAFPAVSYLRKKFPDAEIDWVVEGACADLVKAHPAVNNVWVVETKVWRRTPFSPSTFSAVGALRQVLRSKVYDVVFDLQGNIKSGLILSQAKSQTKVGFGSKSVPEWPNMLFTNTRFDIAKGRNIREDYLDLVSQFFADAPSNLSSAVELKITSQQKLSLMALMGNTMLAGKRKVVVCPGSAWKNKQMEEQALSTLLQHLCGRLDPAFLFAWGTPAEKELADHLQGTFRERSLVLDKMPLPQLQNLMGMADLVVAMDSLPLHLAGTTSVPTLSVFGPSSADKYRPLGPKHFAYQGSCPYGQTFEKRCPVLRKCLTGACIRGLSGDEVYSSFDSWWSKMEEEVKV
jgi:heptosyltransferase-1